MGGQASRLTPLVADRTATDEELLRRMARPSAAWNADDLNGSWLEGQSPLHAAIRARRGGAVVAFIADKGADVNRPYSRMSTVTSFMAHVLSVSAGLFLLAFIYVLGTLTTALLIAHSECHSLWWAVWFGVWLFAPLSRIDRRQNAEQGAVLIYWDLSVFVSYCVVHSSLWTLVVCALILVLCSFYLLLSLVEASAADDLYFEREAQGWTPLHMACYHGDEALVRVLVAKRANVRATDRLGRRPIDVVPSDRQDALAHALGASS